MFFKFHEEIWEAVWQEARLNNVRVGAAGGNMEGHWWAAYQTVNWGGEGKHCRDELRLSHLLQTNNSRLGGINNFTNRITLFTPRGRSKQEYYKSPLETPGIAT